MSNLAVIETRPPPVPLQDMQHMAHAMAASGFFGFKTPDQALAIMLIAHANGQHPASAAQDYDVIQNKPAKKPQAMLRDFLAAGGKVEWHESTPTAAEATFSHPRGGSIRVRWDMERAQQMGLSGKDNYKKQPGVMFRWRCVAEGVRIVYPGATAGLYTPEEALDEAPPVDRGLGAQKPPPTSEKPALSDEAFTKNEKGWREFIAAGNPADSIIAKVQTKYALTDCQIKAIRQMEADAYVGNEQQEASQ